MTALTLLDNGKFAVTETGLVITGRPTFDEISRALDACWTFTEWGKWAQIDLLLYAKDHLDDGEFSQLCDTFRFERGTLLNMLWVGRSFPPGSHARVSGVSLSHHQVVAPARFRDDEKRMWLQLAKANQWSRDELRDKVSLLPATTEEPGLVIPITPGSAVRLVLDWLDSKVNYSADELRHVLREFLKNWEKG